MPDGGDLNWWERVLLAVAGLALGVTGAVAMFATPNQVATAASLLVGSVMLLVAIQGTPLLRAGAHELELTRKHAGNSASRELEKGHADKAYDSLEDAASNAPKLRRDPVYRALTASTFENAVLYRLKLIAAERPGTHVQFDSKIMGFSGNRGPDALLLFDGEEIKIPVEIKYLTSGTFIAWIVSTAQDYFAGGHKAVLLIVSSDQVARRAQNLKDERIVVAAWRDHDDDDRVRQAIDEAYRVAATSS